MVGVVLVTAGSLPGRQYFMAYTVCARMNLREAIVRILIDESTNCVTNASRGALVRLPSTLPTWLNGA